MKYTVTINEKAKTIKVNLGGYEGVAKCCPTDSFNITTGIELALERAKVAKANAEQKKAEKPMGVMELVKALEKALPAGQVVVVGNGKSLNEMQKKWLHALTDCGCKCGGKSEGKCYTDEEIEAIKAEAYDDGYADGSSDGYDSGYDQGESDGYEDGYSDAQEELEGSELTEAEVGELVDTIHNLLAEVLCP